MAAIRSGVTPGCLARCFLRQTGKPSRGSRPPPDIWTQVGLPHSSPPHIPPDDGILPAPVVEASGLPVSLPADPTPIIAQPITRTVETMAAPAVDFSPPPPPPPVLDSSVSADIPALTQPVVEQVVDAAPTAVEVLDGYRNQLSGARAGRLHTCGLHPEHARVHARGSRLALVGGNCSYSDLNLFQKKHDVNPLRGFLVPVVQAPVFISFFVALRKMAYLPVPSLQTGGVLWFTDLTAADPFYILPLAVTGTMFFILELGAESGIDNPNLRAMKTVSGSCLLSSSRSPSTSPRMTASSKHEEGLVSACAVHPIDEAGPCLIGSFSMLIISGLRHPGWKNAQMAQQLQERERRIKNHLDLAAKGPLRQTFTHNPLQQTPPMAAASAKNKAQLPKRKPWKDTLG
ncbi:Mitochondrial inner membrane protein OXA1L [Nibea albiflora]|nr:Mitochondrial inner membrane protein OXA1L [Nibea albiflora]